MELARRLFRWELHGGLDVFYGAAVRYAAIFGAEGGRVYRELAEAEWAKVPARGAGEEWAGGSDHFAITQIMETLAKLSGDLGQLVAVMSRDLSSAYRYLRIGEVCREAGRFEEALRWAEQGLAAFPENTDRRLREFAAGEYPRQGRQEEAMGLVWAEFSDHPGLAAYQGLEKYAREAGVWPGPKAAIRCWSRSFSMRATMRRLGRRPGAEVARIACGFDWPSGERGTTPRMPRVSICGRPRMGLGRCAMAGMRKRSDCW